ncbi:MAG: hypothetical protein FWF57_09710 [Defluviitaleaceae bacterium]|nr:hypothetical protein [Defluviitaleaceae bacterium]
MKSFLAKLLVTIFFVGYIIPIFNIFYVFAQDPVVIHNRDDGMQVGGTATLSPSVINTVPVDQMYFTVPLSDSSATPNLYTLSFWMPTADAATTGYQRIQIEMVRNANILDFRYRVFNQNGNPIPFANFSVFSNTEEDFLNVLPPAAANTFLDRHPNLHINTGNFENPAHPLNPNDPPADHQFPEIPSQGVIVSDRSGTNIDYPAFRIDGSGEFQNGFSFRFANREIHVVLQNNTLHFATSGFEPGYIYEIELERNGTHIRTLNVVSDLDVANVNIIPFANGNRTILQQNYNEITPPWPNNNPAISSEPFVSLTTLNNSMPSTWPRLNREPIDRRHGYNTFENIWPGEEDAGSRLIGNPPTQQDNGSGIIFQIPLPRFTNPTRVAGNIIPLNINLEFPRVEIEDILSANPSTVSVGGETRLVRAHKMNDDYILVRVDDIPAGFYLPNSDMWFSSPLPFTVVSTVVRTAQVEDVHTFLNYRVNRTPAGYTITIISPYDVPAGFNPQYRLLRNVVVGDEMQAAGHAQTPGQVPWTNSTTFAITDPVENYFYYIQFRRAPGANIISSQRILISTDPEAAYIETPLFFEAEGTHERIPGDVLATRGNYVLNLAWDMGSELDIARLFNRYSVEVGNFHEISLDYDVIWGFSPSQIYESIENMTATGTLTTIRAVLRIPNTVTLPMVVTPEIVASLPFQVEYFLVNNAGAVLPNPYIRPEQGTSPALEIHPDFRGPLAENNNNIFRRALPGGIRAGQRSFVSNIVLNVDTIRAGSIGLGPHQRPFQFPYTYFLRITPVRHSLANGTLQSLPVEFPSDFSSITISDHDGMQVPPPQNLRTGNPVTSHTHVGQEVDRVSFDVNFGIAVDSIRNFVTNSHGLIFNNMVDDIQIDISLYISENEAILRDLVANTSGGDWDDANNQILNPNVNLLPRHRFSGLVRVPFIGYIQDYKHHMYFSNLGDDIGMTVPIGQYPQGNLRDALRNGNIVAITGINVERSDLQDILLDTNLEPVNITLTLDGLDENQEYFVVLDTIIRQRGSAIDNNNQVPLYVANASVFSNLSSIITDGTLQLPDGANQYPSAPNLRVEDYGMDYAILEWDRIPYTPSMTDGYAERIEYELIRVRAPQPTVNFMNNRADLSAIWQLLYPQHAPIPASLTAFRMINSNDASRTIQAFDGSNWSNAPATVNYTSETTYNPNTGVGVVSVRDNGLASNTAYFYYLRAVRVIYFNGTEVRRLNSIFANNTVTTTISGAPINLVIEGGREFDRQREVMISFVAPVATLENIRNNNIRFQYQIQIDNGEWGEPQYLDSNFLLASGNNERREITINGEESYHHWFLYHIRAGIEPGRLHNVRVRMVQTLNEGRSYSIWSNTGVWLADTDTAQNEEDRITGDWLDHLREELYKLLRSPYLRMRDDNGAFHVVLRPSLFAEMVNSAVGGQIVLPFNMATQTSYYIPASSFITFVNNELSFVIQGNHMQIVIPHNAIDINNNGAIINAVQALRANQIEDYLVRVNINWSIMPQIHGLDTITPVADILFTLVSVDENLGIWEQYTIEYLADRIDDLSSLEMYVNNIIEAIRNDADNFVLQRHTLNIIEYAEREFVDTVRNSFNSIRANRPQLPVVFDSPLMLSVNNSGGTLSAVEPFHFVNNMWARVATSFNNGSSVFAAHPGSFVFTGREINIPGVGSGAANTMGIVARHGLDEFFNGADGVININDTATRGMLVESVARMLGATRGTNANTWLRNNGISLPPGNANMPISTGEALHMIMLVYSERLNTPVENIRITNFAPTNGLTLNPAFATSFRAAIEIGLYRETDLQPNASISIGELLDVLTNLDRLIGL